MASEKVKLNAIILLTKFEEIDPAKLIADKFKSSHLNSYLKFLENIKKLNLGSKNRVIDEVYKEALEDYVTVRVNWINNYLRFSDFAFSHDDDSLPKYYPQKMSMKFLQKSILSLFLLKNLESFYTNFLLNKRDEYF